MSEQSNQIQATYTGAIAPLTSITISGEPTNDRIIYAGCWDKTIFSWSAKSKKQLHRFQGHADFVKCVLWAKLGTQPILISGSADASIIIWNATTGTRIHTLKGHTRAILDLQLDPAWTHDPSNSGTEIVLFSADTVRDIKRWRISVDSALPEAAESISPHETSVNKLCFEAPSMAEEGVVDADLWTASSDKTARHLVRSRNWEADTTLEHPDFVRDVVVSPDGRWVVTACRDEEVRVWDASSGKLACTYSGHYEEVTGLVIVEDGLAVVSVSIDGTIRKWSLEASEIQKTREEAGNGDVKEQTPEEEPKESMMTAEEEAELADLMDSDDE